MILTGTTRYYNGALGVSLNSSTDTIIIKVDENLNTKWIVSVDINNSTDLAMGQLADEKNVYWMSINTKFISWLFTLDYITGEYINSKWLQHISVNSSIITSSYIKDINVLKQDGDKLIALLSLSSTSYGRLMFCKYFE